MSYPQPDADKYAINGYQFFRLNTQLTSDGDIYESAQGANGFAIGPDSDISKVNLAYFDDQVPRFLNQIAISPQRPFAGSVLARNETKYAPSSRPGRILLWPDELYNPNWKPPPALAVDDWRVDFEAPVLDVVEYFSPLGAGQSQYRNDKLYRYQRIPFPGDGGGGGVGGFWSIIIPWYGRRYCSFFFANKTGANFTGGDISGLNYTIGAVGAGGDSISLATIPAVANGATYNAEILASALGQFDALYFSFEGTNQQATDTVSIRILTSDREA